MCPMRKSSALCILALLLTGSTPQGQATQWQPAAGPLRTRWAADVTPDTVLPDTPARRWSARNGATSTDCGTTRSARGGAAPTAFDGKILVPFPVESALSGVMKKVGADERLWYRRTFEVPPAWRGKRVLLHFGAVDWERPSSSTASTSARTAAATTPFTFDITDALEADGRRRRSSSSVWDPTDDRPQPRGKQVNRPGGIWYTPVTGIWQTVWIEPVPQAHIDSLKIVPDVDRGSIVRRRRPMTDGDRGRQRRSSVTEVVLDGNARSRPSAGADG